MANNRDVFQQYIDMWNSGNIDLAESILSPTYKDHAHPKITDLAALKDSVKRIRASNPDLSFTIETTIEEGDLLAIVRKTMYGSRIVDRGMWLARISDGLLTELWTFYDRQS